MDRLNQNQVELEYSCDAGDAKYNLYNGKFIFQTEIDAIDEDNYKLPLFCIYNNTIKSLNSFMGNKWKLNVQQMLITKNNKYCLIDSFGDERYFDLFMDNEYYDVDGLGLYLKIGDEIVISDQQNNKYYFENNLLSRKQYGFNEQLIEYYIYDENGRIIEIYNSIDLNQKFLFTYDCNRLSKIKKIKGEDCINEYYFSYLRDKLIKIDIYENNIILDTIIYKYIEDKLCLATRISSQNSLKINFLYDKIQSIINCKCEITKMEETDNERLESNIYCGDELYLGSKNNIYSYIVNDDNFIIVKNNNFIYGDNYRIVENESNVRIIYNYNQNGFLVSMFEIDDDDKLRTIEKNSGYTFSYSNNDSESINSLNSININTNNLISTSNYLANSLDELNYYRRRVCYNYKYFSFSFWLKLCSEINNNIVQLAINGNNENISSVAYIDGTAVNVWQLVKFDVEINFNEIIGLNISFNDNNLSHFLKLNNFNICFSESNHFYVTNGVDWCRLDDITKIRYSDIYMLDYQEISIDNDNFITDFDIKAMYFDMFSRNRGGYNYYPYALSLNNGKIKIPTRKVFLVKNNISFEMKLSNDDYGAESRANFFYEVRSPDGNQYNYSFIHLLNSDEFGDIIACFQEANLFIKGSSNHKESFECKYYDLYGKLLFEQDEYGVQKLYEYDPYGNLITKMICNENTNETICQSSNGLNSNIINEMDSANNIIKTSFGDENYFIENVFDNGKMIKTSDSNGSTNYIKYENSGKVLQIINSPYNSDDFYGIKIKYDILGNPISFNLLSKSSGILTQNLLVEKKYNSNNLITNIYRNTNNIDNITLSFDKYGRTTEVIENNKTTIIEREDVNSSKSSSKITKITDPYAEKESYFNYSIHNNLISYVEKEQNNEVLSIRKIDDSSCERQFNNAIYKTNIEYDENKLINSRILKTIDADITSTIYNLQVNEKMITNYQYDLLNRLSSITRHNKRNNSSYPGSIINISNSYKSGTYLKSGINYNCSQYSVAATYSYNFLYEYNSNNLIKKKRLLINNQECTQYNNIYTYDDLSRIILVRNDCTNSSTHYYYNSEGQIDHYNDSNNYYCFNYEKGRLINVTLNNEIHYTCNYDNYGNMISINNDNLLWDRVSLLKKYITNNQEYEFNYNNEGLLINRKIGQNNIKLIYENNKLIAEIYSNKSVYYIYDNYGIIGFIIYPIYGNEKVCYYIKDSLNNVIAIYCDGEIVAEYDYDIWGNTFITKNIDNIAEINSFRWKSQYYIKEISCYLIGKRYYIPYLMQYINPEGYERLLSECISIHSLNQYNITDTNMINYIFDENNLNTCYELIYEPPELAAISSFFKTRKGRIFAVFLWFFVLVSMIIITILTVNPAFLFNFFIDTYITILFGGTITGIVSAKQGNSFFSGFYNYINNELSKDITITSIINFSIGVFGLVSYSIRKSFIDDDIFMLCRENGIEVRKVRLNDIEYDAWITINEKNKRFFKATKSSLKDGLFIHKGYKVNFEGKEFAIFDTAKRIDFYNAKSRTIFELKPNNLKSVQRGIKQLLEYDRLLGGGNKLVLVLY